MITVTDPTRPLDRSLLRAEGGFAWWYVDLVDAQGNGIVVIAAFGLPFLPGYARSARAGSPERAGDRPSLNIVVYRGGEPDFYLLQEYAPEECSWAEEGEQARFGRSTVHSRVQGSQRHLSIALDVEVPHLHERLTGTVEVVGAAIQHGALDGRGGDLHRWTPLTTACAGVADLRLGDRPWVNLSGRAYHDRNGCPVPLHELGIDHWLWGRVPLPGRELVHYLLWPEDPEAPPRALVLDIADDGRVERHEDVDVQLDGRRTGWFGMPWWSRVTLGLRDGTTLDIEHDRLVDDGFFYLRFGTRLLLDGRETRGVAEAVRPGRVDLDWQRPLVRMAVHHTARRNSLWLPLFCGPSTGRWSRLVTRRGRVA